MKYLDQYRPNFQEPKISNKDGVNIFTYKDHKIGVKAGTQEQLKRENFSQEITENGLLYISQEEQAVYHFNFNPKFLQYALVNEVLCPYPPAQKGKCRSVLDEEFSLVPEEIYDEYLEWRIRFFKSNELLYIHYQKQSGKSKEGIDMADIDESGFPKGLSEDARYEHEMNDCWKYLEKLQQSRNQQLPEGTFRARGNIVSTNHIRSIIDEIMQENGEVKVPDIDTYFQACFGEEEKEKGEYVVKNLESGEEEGFRM